MVKQFFKKKSKRISTKRRCKIEKKVREHDRKIRKQRKKNPQKIKRKDPGVPNSLPFKEEIVKEAVALKQKDEELKEKLKRKRKRDRQKAFDKKRTNLDGLVKDAQKRTADFEKKAQFSEKQSAYNGGTAVENSMKQYFKEFKKVINGADVILEILDARDPLGSRCPQVEQAVLESGTKKRLVLVLNKIDLVPKENVEAWLKYLRNEFPTVPFKASTQNQKENLGRANVPLLLASEELRKSSRCLGADILMKLLANYCRNRDIKTSITVGIVGFPNTGKSSIINSLKRSRACQVGATPGVTKSMQEVQLDKHIRLLDSPGIVMPDGSSDAAVILRNCVKIESIKDPIPPVEAILRRCNKHQIMLHYNLPFYEDANEFVALMAKTHGKLKKGGIPDVNKAAKSVLMDWNLGRITYYTHPPEDRTLHVESSIVQEMAAEFDIEALAEEELSALKGLKCKSRGLVVKTMGPTDGVMDEENEEEMADASSEEKSEEERADASSEEKSEEEMADASSEEKSEEEMEEEDETVLKSTTVTLSASPARSKKQSLKSLPAKKHQQDPKFSIDANFQQQQQRKKDFKASLKKRRRADALAGKLSDALTGALDLKVGADQGEAYDFSTDFK